MSRNRFALACLAVTFLLLAAGRSSYGQKLPPGPQVLTITAQARTTG